MAIFQAIFENILVPEITAFIKSRIEAGQPMPTDAEIIAKLNDDADAVIAKGQEWLASHPLTPPPA